MLVCLTLSLPGHKTLSITYVPEREHGWSAVLSRPVTTASTNIRPWMHGAVLPGPESTNEMTTWGVLLYAVCCLLLLRLGGNRPREKVSGCQAYKMMRTGTWCIEKAISSKPDVLTFCVTFSLATRFFFQCIYYVATLSPVSPLWSQNNSLPWVVNVWCPQLVISHISNVSEIWQKWAEEISGVVNTRRDWFGLICVNIGYIWPMVLFYMYIICTYMIGFVLIVLAFWNLKGRQ